MSHGLGRTSLRSGILIHVTVWPQYTNVTDTQDRQTQAMFWELTAVPDPISGFREGNPRIENWGRLVMVKRVGRRERKGVKGVEWVIGEDVNERRGREGAREDGTILGTY